MKNVAINKQAITWMEDLTNFFSPKDITTRSLEIQSIINEVCPEKKKTSLFLTNVTKILHEAEYLASAKRERVLLTRLMKNYTAREAVDHCIDATIAINSNDSDNDHIGDHSFYLMLMLKSFREVEFPDTKKPLKG